MQHLFGDGEGTSRNQVWTSILLEVHLYVDELAKGCYGMPCLQEWNISRFGHSDLYSRE